MLLLLLLITHCSTRPNEANKVECNLSAQKIHQNKFISSLLNYSYILRLSRISLFSKRGFHQNKISGTLFDQLVLWLTINVKQPDSLQLPLTPRKCSSSVLLVLSSCLGSVCFIFIRWKLQLLQNFPLSLCFKFIFLGEYL